MHTTAAQEQFVILPPARSAAPRIFRNVRTDVRCHEDLLAEMQRLRGSAYVRDGAIREEELTPDGRHVLSIDEHSWHVLTLDTDRRVCGCLRYLEEKRATRFEELWVEQSALARCPKWGRFFRRAVQNEMTRARAKRFGFGEVGGWAVAENRRWTTDPLRMVLAACALFRVLGGCVGLATATVRHSSAAILRRIGLGPLTIDGVELPPYYDPHYGCEMEALRFDSDFPNPRYAAAIRELSVQLETVPVICQGHGLGEWRGLVRGLEIRIPSQTPPALIPLAG